MSAIYVVIGTTGEYSDRREWNVVALYSKEAADKYADACKMEAERIKSQKETDEEGWFSARYNEGHPAEWTQNKFDPQFEMSYTGTDYVAVEVPLHYGPKTLEELQAERVALESRLVQIDAEMEAF